MDREGLIQYIKANDTHYRNFTFGGHSYQDLFEIKQHFEEEKRKEEKCCDRHRSSFMFSKLFYSFITIAFTTSFHFIGKKGECQDISINTLGSSGTSGATKGLPIPRAAIASNADIITRIWSNSPFEQKVFIENKGQYHEELTGIKEKIFFCSVSGGVNIYFTQTGIIYGIDEAKEEQNNISNENKYEEYREEKEYKEKYKRKLKIIHHLVKMEWLDSNPGILPQAEEKAPFYYTYTHDPDKEKGGLKASAYKKVIYRNIYSFIDLEIIFPEEGKTGIKYSFVLHPGANPTDIKLQWNGDKISQDNNGNLIIKSPFGDLIDHAPETFYEGGEKIPSWFALNGNIVSFSLPASVIKSKKIIIDPWTSNPTFTTNKAYDINYDFAGNVYAYGSGTGGTMTTPGSPFQLAKFNNAGVLQWIFTASSIAVIGNLYGDFTINQRTGSSYLGQGLNNTSGARVVKVNTLGSQVAISTGYPAMREIWRMDYNYCNGTIIAAGGGTANPSQQAFILDTNLVNITPIPVVSSNPDIDAALLSTDKYSTNAYMLFAKEFTGSYPSLDNLLVECPLPNLVPVSWNVLTQHTFTEVSSVNYYTAIIMNQRGNGFNGITVSPSYVYTYDGRDIKKWNKANGSFVSSLNVSNTLFSWGGLDVDECDNLYVGVNQDVKVYDASFNLTTTYNLTDVVYDLKLSKNKQYLYACGNTFISQIDLPPLQLLQATATPATCSNCNGTATVNVCNSNAFTYSWSPGGQTTATITGLCAGSYSVTVISGCDTLLKDTITVPATGSGPGFTLTASSTPASCANNNGATNVSVNGGTQPFTYTWSPGGQTSSSATGLGAGNYTVIVTDANGCTNQQPVSVLAGGNLQVTAGPLSTICIGQSVTLAASGGTNYLWSNGSTNSTIVVTPTATATYTVFVSDTVSGCSGDTSVTVNISPPPAASATNATVCSGQTATLTASGGGNYSWSNGQTTSSITVAATATATYSVIVSVGACSDTAYCSVGVNPSPLVALGNNQTICDGQITTLDAGNSGASYLWSTGETTQIINATGAGTYWVIVGLNNCLAKDTVSTFIAPKVHLYDSSLCTISPIILDPGAGASNYLWSNGSTTQTISVDVAGTYWVVAIFGSCMSGDSSHITGDGTGGGLFIPNAFTPNEDNLNEVFLAMGTGIQLFDMNVFDRWGNLIFTSDNVNKGWNGKIEGGHYAGKKNGSDVAQEDVYVWTINYTTQCFPNKKQTMIGHVSIVK